MTAGTIDIALALIIGICGGMGLVLMCMALPRWAAPSLVRRIAPYIRDVTDPIGATPFAVVKRRKSVTELAALGGNRLGSWAVRLGGSDDLKNRLAKAGSSLTPTAFRSRQLGWALAAAAGGAAMAIALALTGRANMGSIAVPILAAVTVVLLWEWLLSKRVAKRSARIADELPVTLEFLALCLSAGESLRDALERISTVGSGEVARELRYGLLRTETGENLTVTLVGIARRLDVTSFTRAVDHLTAALERGAPLVQVLHAQADDARGIAKQRLMESAGRKEILMLLPLVFFILPLSILFAVYPGIYMLRSGF